MSKLALISKKGYITKIAELLVEKLTMTRRKRLPKNIRKYIRQEKARLRRQVLDLKERKKGIEEIYKKTGIKKEEPASTFPSKTAKVKSIAKKKIK